VKAFLRIVAVSAVLVAPGVARAGETPNPGVTACIAQYTQLGAAGFVAKYGTGDAGKRACVQANGGTTVQQPVTKPVTQPGTNDLGTAVAAHLCAGESSEAGKRACIQAKLAQAQTILSSCSASAGASKSALEQCIKQAIGTKTPTQGNAEKAAMSACAAEAKALGYDAFQQKYGRGKDGLAACLRARR
jgi:hypothetical protein